MAGVPSRVRREYPLMSVSSSKSMPDAICRHALMGMFSSSVPTNSGIYLPSGSSTLSMYPSATAMPIKAETKDFPIELDTNTVFSSPPKK